MPALRKNRGHHALTGYRCRLFRRHLIRRALVGAAPKANIV